VDVPQLREVGVGELVVPYLDVGDPGGPPVVMIPGLTDGLGPVSLPRTRELFTSLPLPMERVRGLVISHRQPVVAPVTTRQLAADIAATLRELLDGPAVLVCHSMGGMVAQHLAADHPELVRGSVLTATAAVADARIAAVLARWEALVVAHRFDDFVAAAVGDSFPGSEGSRRVADVRRDPPPHPPVELVARHVALSAACATHDARDRLASIAQPTLVVAGRLDAVIPIDLARALAAGLPDARLVELDGLGHGFPDQDPVGFERHVVPFVDELIAAGS
jgi:pimeloyl-ACP methyl ester carboxylesterase